MDATQTIKTSGLQKKILTVIYLSGKKKAVGSIDEDRLKNEPEIQERVNEWLACNGNLTDRKPYIQFPGFQLHYRFDAYEMPRSRLACKLFNWEDYNIYTDWAVHARFKYRFPKNYNNRNVVLTNSLRSLARKKLIRLFNAWEEETASGKARFVRLTLKGIKLAERLTIKSSMKRKDLIDRQEGGEQYGIYT